MLRFSQDSMSLAAAGNYTAEDVMSNSASAGRPWRFDRLGDAGYITKAIALCTTTGLTPRLTLFLFAERPGCVLNDNVANTCIIAGNRGSYIGKIDFPAMEDLGTGISDTIATPNTVGNLPLAFYTRRPLATLWGVLVTRDAITGEAAGMELTIILGAEESYYKPLVEEK
jgi:hypothetical protein